MFNEILEHHICTEEDYDEFYPITPKLTGQLEAIKQDPDRGFFCIDWSNDRPYTLYGDENDDSYRNLEVLLLPCNSIHDDFGIMQGELGEIRPDCVTSLEE